MTLVLAFFKIVKFLFERRVPLMSLKFFSNLCGLVCSFHCHTVVSWSKSDFKLFLAVEIKPAQEVAELKCPQGICVIKFECRSFMFLALWLGPTMFTFFSLSLFFFCSKLLLYVLSRIHYWYIP